MARIAKVAPVFCDKCDERLVADNRASTVRPERWLCTVCLADTTLASGYTVARWKGEAFVARLMRMRERAALRLPLFDDQEEGKHAEGG